MASYDTAVPPGGEGNISIKITTKGLKGKLRKNISVYTNDPANSRANLTITASIKPFINIEPKRAVNLMGKPGETKSAVVIISGREDRPLILEEKYFDLTGKVEYSLEMVEENRLYKLSIQNLPDTKGNFRGYLKLKTNYPENPEISIYIRGRFINTKLSNRKK